MSEMHTVPLTGYGIMCKYAHLIIYSKNTGISSPTLPQLALVTMPLALYYELISTGVIGKL